MSLNATIAKLNQQNDEIAQMYRDLRKQETRIIAASIGFTVGFTAVMTYKIMSTRK